MAKKPLIVLMAEDNEHDIIAAQRAWRLQKMANPLYIVRDGEECLDYLYRRGLYNEPSTSPRPSILLLDLHMPRKDGLSVLKEIRSSEALRRLPVVILTTSQLEEERLQGYDLGANAFIRKPVGFESLSQALKTINLFWELVELPEPNHGDD